MSYIFSNEENNKISFMKEKAENIEVFLSREFNDVIISDDYIIAGGLFPSLYHGENINDIDIFFLKNKKIWFDKIFSSDPFDHKENIETISKDYTYNFKMKDGNYLGNHNIDRVATVTLNPMQKTKITSSLDWVAQTKMQFILTKYETKKELLDHFDFVHCQMNYTKHRLHVSPYVLHAINNKELILNDFSNKKTPLWRVEKYKSRGYDFGKNNETVFKEKSKFFDRYLNR